MKVYVMVVDTLTGLSQNGMIEEPIKEGLEIQNALRHFGVESSLVKWFCHNQIDTTNLCKMGIVEGTNKTVSIVTI
jgi:hypothetical protein